MNSIIEEERHSRIWKNVNPRWVWDVVALTSYLVYKDRYRVAVRSSASGMLLFETDTAMYSDVMDMVRVRSRAMFWVSILKFPEGLHVWQLRWESHGIEWMVAFKTTRECNEAVDVLMADEEAEYVTR
jgi:hypothetical protein